MLCLNETLTVYEPILFPRLKPFCLWTCDYGALGLSRTNWCLTFLIEVWLACAYLLPFFNIFGLSEQNSVHVRIRCILHRKFPESTEPEKQSSMSLLWEPQFFFQCIDGTFCLYSFVLCSIFFHFVTCDE
jgi:hypothetical protein